jgi:precorrin-6B methylase 2
MGNARAASVHIADHGGRDATTKEQKRLVLDVTWLYAVAVTRVEIQDESRNQPSHTALPANPGVAARGFSIPIRRRWRVALTVAAGVFDTMSIRESRSMSTSQCVQRALLAFLFATSVGVTQAQQQAAPPFEPTVGQAGKDVVWVPTPPELVEKMLDMAEVTPQDFVMDLGSGDGRNIIGAAKRGARARGVEYNADMVELSRRTAAAAGVADKATFIQGDMFASDFSEASVLALFLLPSNMLQLRSKFLDLKPGTRIVANQFGIEGWTPDQTETISNCTQWCTALLWIVPAKVQGTWRLAQGDLTLKQDYQMISGTLGGTPITNGRLRGVQITFSAGGADYTGRVDGDAIEGTVRAGGNVSTWTARRSSS